MQRFGLRVRQSDEQLRISQGGGPALQPQRLANKAKRATGNQNQDGDDRDPEQRARYAADSLEPAEPGDGVSGFELVESPADSDFRESVM